jgi:prefoldin subunit 5
MAKSKNKTHSEIQFLRGEIKHLKRKLKECHKAKGIESLDDEELEVEEVDAELCENCGKGVLLSVDLGLFVIKKCDHCEFREKSSKKKKQD